MHANPNCACSSCARSQINSSSGVGTLQPKAYHQFSSPTFALPAFLRRVRPEQFEFTEFEAPPLPKKCIKKPNYLSLQRHFFVPSKPSSKGWASTGLTEQLQIGKLNPGFINSTNQSLLLDPKLDPLVKDLMNKLHKGQAPFNKEPYTTFLKRKGKVRIALVNLSTPSQLVSPQVAEFNSTVETYGASLAKLVPLYAAFQLKFDLNFEAAKNPKAFSPKQLEALKNIFDISTTSGSSPIIRFEFNPKFLRALDEICHNCDASFVINSLGFNLIASALWQSGLYDCQRGGLWVGANYGHEKTCPSTPPKSWHSDPIGSISHGVTALAVATYFTLLAQSRLIDSSSSNKIMANLIPRDLLSPGNNRCPSYFVWGLNHNESFQIPSKTDAAASKIGIYYAINKPEYYHEGSLIQRHHNGRTLRYAVSILTQCISDYKVNYRRKQGKMIKEVKFNRIGHLVLSDLITHLDNLIANS